ncbi:MAG: phenylalanine 4-monooxygenase [Myxococcota bacterium]
MQQSDPRVHLVDLDRDHPGFRDDSYRHRRNEIAALALLHQSGAPAPFVDYTAEEHQVWAEVWRHLEPLHVDLACRPWREASARLGLSRTRIPQFQELNAVLQPAFGFRLSPVAGLVTPRVFLEQLAQDCFLATQYMRHCSRPLYTPEPDVIHELVGHGPGLLDEAIVGLSRAFGQAVAGASAARELALIRVYWWTLEFGVVIERGKHKAYGAGLLSSFGELGRFSEHAELRPFDLAEMAATAFDPTDYQTQLFVARSYDHVVADLHTWLNQAVTAPESTPLA